MMFISLRLHLNKLPKSSGIKVKIATSTRKWKMSSRLIERKSREGFRNQLSTTLFSQELNFMKNHKPNKFLRHSIYLQKQIADSLTSPRRVTWKSKLTSRKIRQRCFATAQLAWALVEVQLTLGQKPRHRKCLEEAQLVLSRNLQQHQTNKKLSAKLIKLKSRPNKTHFSLQLFLLTYNQAQLVGRR